MNKSNKEALDPNCYTAGLTNFEETRLHHIKKNISKAESLLSLSYFVIGENLLEARDILKNHDFKEWINKNCNFKIRTAYNTMNAVLILREYPTLMSLDKHLLYYMGTRTFPKKLIQLLADHSVGDLQLSKVDLIALETSYLDGKITEDSTLVLNHLKNQKNVNIRQRWYTETTKLLKNLKRESNNIKSMKAAQELVVGENKVITKCSKTLDDLLSEAIKKVEALAKEIERHNPLKTLTVPETEIEPLDPLDVRAMVEHSERRNKAIGLAKATSTASTDSPPKYKKRKGFLEQIEKEHLKALEKEEVDKTPHDIQVIDCVIEGPQEHDLQNGTVGFEQEKEELKNPGSDTTGNAAKIDKNLVEDLKKKGSAYFKMPDMGN